MGGITTTPFRKYECYATANTIGPVGSARFCDYGSDVEPAFTVDPAFKGAAYRERIDPGRSRGRISGRKPTGDFDVWRLRSVTVTIPVCLVAWRTIWDERHTENVFAIGL